MDECDTAAQIYQCGREKAPLLVANMISAVEFNQTAVSCFNTKRVCCIITRY
jgi:hypothetical protein